MLPPGRTPSQADLAAIIDHTLLRPTAGPADFDRLCDEAARYAFWSVCVPPARVPSSALRLKGTGVKVSTVVGFPLGYNSPETKLSEAQRAILAGADEIDMVMSLGAFKGGELGLVSNEIAAVSSACRDSGRVLKVIIECCYLTDEEKVKASKTAEEAGAHFVKTSTGFGPGGATSHDVALIKAALSEKARVKASGGISSLAKALEMVRAGADRIGTSSGVSILEELANGPGTR